MALFAYLNSALRFEATKTHLTGGGRTAEESQGGGGEVSGEVSEARAVPRPCPHSPHPQRPASCCESAKVGGVVQCPTFSLCPFYLIASHPQQIPAHQAPGFSAKRCLFWQSPLFPISFGVCLVQSLFREETMADGFSARATACNAAEWGQWGRSLKSLDSTPMHRRGRQAPGLCVRAASLSARYRIFLLDRPYREPVCQVLGFGGSSFLCWLSPIPCHLRISTSLVI